MRVKMTSKGRITIPAPIRRKLGLKKGQVLDFDEQAPFLKAVVVFDEDEMRSVLGCAAGAIAEGSEQWMEETRGSVELPPKTPGA